MIVDPFPLDSARPTVLHIRTQVFSDQKAPFIRQTILGLRPFFRNVVLAPKVEGELPPDLHFERVTLRTLRDQAKRHKLVEQLREKYPSISLVVGHMGNGSLAGSFLSRSLGVPLMGVFGGSDVNKEFLMPRYRANYEELISIPAARFLTVADYLRKKLISYGGQSNRLFTWHRGVDLDRVKPAEHAQADQNRPVKALVTARLLEVKGHEFLVKALGLLRQRNIDVELHALGDGPLQGELEQLANQLGVTDLVKFHGHVSHATVREMLSQADLYVHPSVKCSEGKIEGVPNAVMEAHAAGLPVVASDSGGISEVVVADKTGFLVPERDPEALADRIAVLAKDRALRIEMGQRGRDHVRTEFALPTQSRRLAAHITHTIQAGQLHALRGWTTHRPQNRDSKTLTHSAGRGYTQIMNAVNQARYDSKIPIIGPIITLTRRAAWIVLVRPYIRVFAAELDRSVLEPAARKHAGAAKQAAVAQHAAAALHAEEALLKTPSTNNNHSQANLPDRPRMSDAACADCPHCSVGATWPTDPCPLDSGCLTALKSEFATRDCLETHPLEAGTLRLTDQDLSPGQALPYSDGSQTSIQIQASLQSVDDIPRLFEEVARTLAEDGAVTLQIGPLPQGADAIRLQSDLRIPFAQHLFSESLLADAKASNQATPQQITAASLDAAVSQSGLTFAAPPFTPKFLEPCPVDFQARFSLALRHLGATKEQVAPYYYAVLCHASAPTETDNADSQ
jgi:colanic acid/amylovoran biosynthesis glycosyltransferase